MSIAPVDWAAEWLRPMPPNFKFVGPILSEPGKPLPADLEVSCPPRDPLSLPTFVEKRVKRAPVASLDCGIVRVEHLQRLHIRP